MKARLNPSLVLPIASLVLSALLLAFVLMTGGDVTEVTDVAGAAGGSGPAFRLGMSLTLTAVFGLVWLFGIHYPDVGWMVVMTSLLPLETAFTGQLVGGGVARFALVLALGGFLATFFRRTFKPGHLELAATALLCLFAACGALLPLEVFRASGLGGTFQSYACAVVLAYAAIYGVFSLGPLPPKRQRYSMLMAGACLLAAVGFAAEGRFGGVGVARLPLMSHVLVSVFALFLVADLVIFHSRHFLERASRAERDNATAERQARQVLGRSVQQLIGSQDRDGRYGEFQFAFDFLPSVALGGDWIFSWDIGRERRLLYGHVEGKGARAALGMAAVVGFLHEARERSLTLQETANLINARLLDVFDQQVTSTLQAVSVGNDGTVELFACGGPGFFIVSRDGSRHHAMNSTLLGVAGVLESASLPIVLDDSDVLLGGTEGLLDEERIARIINHYEEELDHEQSFTAVRGVVTSLGEAPVDEDRTLLLVQRVAS